MPLFNTFRVRRVYKLLTNQFCGILVSLTVLLLVDVSRGYEFILPQGAAYLVYYFDSVYVVGKTITNSKSWEKNNPKSKFYHPLPSISGNVHDVTINDA